MDDVNLERRLTILEIGQKNMQGQLETILTNHLPHLHECLSSMEMRMSKLEGAMFWLKGRQLIILSLVLGTLGALGGVYYLLFDLLRRG